MVGIANFKMELAFILMCAYPVLVCSITVSSNGNSPKMKMVGGMMVDAESKIDTVTQAPVSSDLRQKSNYEKSKKINFNSTKLSANERYRRLIPYMTFYYANDLPSSTTEDNSLTNIEVQKAQIVETATIERNPKKVIHSSYRTIPRYKNNRIPQYSVSQSDHTKLYPTYQASARDPSSYNHLVLEKTPAGQLYERIPHKHLQKIQLSAPTRKPQYDLYHNDDYVHYYLAEKETNKYKLVPYEQAPPVKVNENEFNPGIVSPSLVKDSVYLKPRPARPHYAHETKFLQPTARKPTTVVTEHYYEKIHPEPHKLVQPVIEGGFKPIVRPTEAPVLYTTVAPATDEETNAEEQVQIINTSPAYNPQVYDRPKYYQYVVDKPMHKPAVTNSVTLNDLISSLRINKPVPKPVVQPNMGSSIRTLLQVLNVLRVMPHQNELEPPVLSTPKPFQSPDVVIETTNKPILSHDHVELNQEPYLADVNPPSQHLDEYRISDTGSTTQEFPLKIYSDDEGGTPGRPGVDYPILTIIPPTRFDCKTQRYKGFFADPETRCQVWHYCDLNGGQASFLCPNGTIFSQAALTCDWWFNVRCASTAQLYVLNESLYKYILPHSPKFPEDYSGPLVDKYLTLKFKEMEEQFKKNKNRQSSAEDREDSEEVEEEPTRESPSEPDETSINGVSESSVVVESPGTSGNLHRIQE